MPKKKTSAEEPENSDRWLLTYADLITLLLGLFVILYSMSDTNVAKYESFVAALGTTFGGRGVFGGQKSVIVGPIREKINPAMKDTKGGLSSEHKQLIDNLSDLLKDQISANEVEIINTPGGVSIHLLDTLLFNTGEADILLQALPTLDMITKFLETTPNLARVEGHTDNVPIHNQIFPSNWHLSVARAMNTGYYLIQKGIPPQRISIAGFSEYQPIVPNDTDENRAKNRRVEIIILDETINSIQTNASENSTNVQ